MDKSTARAILVIDDDEHVRAMLAFALRDRGYQVVAVESGEMAVAQAQGRRFDLAICDIVMPGMGGIATLTKLKQMQPHLTVIMATGHATAQTALVAMKHGAYNYIAKPYALKDIFTLLEQAFSPIKRAYAEPEPGPARAEPAAAISAPRTEALPRAMARSEPRGVRAVKINVWMLVAVLLIAFVAFRALKSSGPEEEQSAATRPPPSSYPASYPSSYPSSTSAPPPIFSAQSAHGPQAVATRDQCLQQFDAERDLAELNRKMSRTLAENKSVDVPAIDAGLLRYAQCRAFLKRNPSSCAMLDGLASRWGPATYTRPYCREQLKDLMLWRDLSHGSAFDEWDYAYFRPFVSASDVRALADEFNKLWRQRDSDMCAKLGKRLNAEARGLCSAMFKRALPRPFKAAYPPMDPRNLDDILMNHLWHSTSPNCEVEPIFKRQGAVLTSLNRGMCGAMFDKTCDHFIIPAKTFYCDAQ